ncbi:MAG: DUF3794 domain-containing protein [Clostridia bacterium]|nr:DUF3794 domain-containing protein [Clostridia bacterium]
MFNYTSDGTKNCVVTRIFEETTTKEITAEYNLPDYLPDVTRILCTDAKLCRAGKYINGSVLEFDGEIYFSVIYSTADGVIKCAKFSSEYDGSISVGEYSGDCDINAESVIESVGCRLQNPRKLTARAKVKVSVDAVCAKCTSPAVTGKLTPDEEQNVQSRTDVLDVCFRVSATDADVKLEENIEIPKNLPQADEIICVLLEPCLTDIRASDGNISYKGNILAKILYSALQETPSSQPEYRCFTKKLPFSGDLSAAGINERCYCTGNCCVTSSESLLSPDADGEMRTIELDAVYSVYLDAFCNASSEVTTDMYSTDYESSTEEENVTYETALTSRTFNCTQSVCAEINDDDATEVVCCRATADITNAAKSNGKLVFEGNLTVSAVLYDGNELYSGKTFTSPFRAECDAGFVPDGFDYTANAAVMDSTCRIDRGNVCADVEIGINYVIFAKSTASVTSKLSVEKDKPRNVSSVSSITLYYPSKTDTMWDIAKKYGTTRAEIAALNGINGEIPSGDVMIIPKRKAKKPIYTKII